MALTTFVGLKASVASWINRTDLSAQIPDFVVLAEALIARTIKVRSQETVVTGTLTGETLAHPTGMLSARRLLVADLPLDYLTPEQYAELKYATVSGGKFTSIGSTFYILGGASTDTYELTYIGTFTALSADTDTNFVLTNAPEVYLWAALHYAAVYMKDVNAATGYLSLYQAAMGLLNAQEKEAKHSGGRMTVRAEFRE